MPTYGLKSLTNTPTFSILGGHLRTPSGKRCFVECVECVQLQWENHNVDLLVFCNQAVPFEGEKLHTFEKIPHGVLLSHIRVGKHDCGVVDLLIINRVWQTHQVINWKTKEIK